MVIFSKLGDLVLPSPATSLPRKRPPAHTQTALRMVRPEGDRERPPTGQLITNIQRADGEHHTDANTRKQATGSTRTDASDITLHKLYQNTCRESVYKARTLRGTVAVFIFTGEK